MENIGKLTGQNRGWIKIHGNDSFKHITVNMFFVHLLCLSGMKHDNFQSEKIALGP